MKPSDRSWHGILSLAALVVAGGILLAWTQSAGASVTRGGLPVPQPTGTPVPLPSPTPTPTPLPEPKLSIISPAGFTSPATPLISRSETKIVISVDHPYLVKGVQVALNSTSGSVPLGEAKQVGRSHIYELLWNLDTSPAPGSQASGVPDGNYTIRATLKDKGTSAERTITVRRETDDPTAPPAEHVEIVAPLNGRPAPVTEDIVREIVVDGTASPGTEGVTLFYSVEPFGAPPKWQTTRCGFARLNGTGTAPQPFSAGCTLGAGHLPADVTAIGAVSYDCTIPVCDPTPGAVTNQGAGEGSDSVAVYPCWGDPCLSLSPKTWRADVKTCQKVVVDVAATQGIPAVPQNVDVRLSGPGKRPEFCEVKGSTSWRVVDPGGSGIPVHIDGMTNASGRFIFGVTSDVSSYKSIYEQFEYGHSTVEAWLDRDLDDNVDPNEDVHTGEVHWDLPGRCTVVGTPGDDVLHPAGFPSKICGLGGDDEIHGLDGATGDDVILGGPGNDVIYANRGNDRIEGGAGNDLILGGDGDDRIWGGGGDDDIFGGIGKNLIYGGSGRDGCGSSAELRGKKGNKRRIMRSPPPEQCERDPRR